MDTAAAYRRFAQFEARGHSAIYDQWATGIADDPALLGLIDDLPPDKRQPNLVLGSARFIGIAPGPFSALRDELISRWDEVRATALVRRTQTNEPGRCAVLLPLLAALPGPLALLEVGASAGLCLYPDRYSYRYSNGIELDPPGGRSSVVLECAVSGPVPLPSALPEVVWRAGIDLNPLDAANAQDMRWLETLVWPEQQHRRDRLRRAARVAAADPPLLVRGDIVQALPLLAASAPPAATLVVFHSAVLAYVPPAGREAFADQITRTPGHWISNEGPTVVGYDELPPSPDPSTGSFVLALDGAPVAYTGAHGQSLQWFV